MKELVDRGHDVTFISCYPQKEPMNNLRDISVRDDIREPLQAYHSRMNVATFQDMTYWEKLEAGLEFGIVTTKPTLSSENVLQLLNSTEKFDLVILEHFMNEALFILPHIFESHLVLVAPGPTTLFTDYLMSNPAPASYVPNFFSGYTSRMGFWERLFNTYYEFFGEIYIHTRMLPEQNVLLKETLPDAPSLSELLYKASLMLVTSHSLSDPVPLQQNVKEIGGYHMDAPQPLPEDIKEFMDNATEGVVIFSMGSHLKSDRFFPPEKRQAILNIFSRIKQKVLWKFESELEGKPDNVKILSWLPQQDVLGHPNTVAFITHGGLLGTIEAVYHGVPILGLPIVWDQSKNIEEAVHKGMGIKLDFLTWNEKDFGDALNDLLNKPSYRKNAKLRSKILRDQPMHPLEKAIFWIEYVIHHNGAAHLRSGAMDLSWYQKYPVDLVLVLFSFIISVVLMGFLAHKRYYCRVDLKNKTD
ncbi:hypothetical protein JTB14_010686 [Gonioctena quinquepunctata]|nr:hypothetical protein JTB14_010686 [Gonioctena quinquepunctata]